MLTVHHLNNSRSQRVLWLLEALGTPYEVKRYERDAKTMLAPASLKAVHPLGKSPVVTDGDRTIAETGAIFEYLLDNYGAGKLRPAAVEDQLRYTYWMHFAEGSAMPPLVMTLVFAEMPKRMPALLRPVGRIIESAVQRGYLGPTLAAQLDFMDAELARTGWFAGPEMTAADILMSFPIETANARLSLGRHAHLRDWLARIAGDPSYRTALEKGGAYDYAVH